MTTTTPDLLLTAPLPPPIRITIEGVAEVLGPLTIEFSRGEPVVVLRAEGEDKTLRGTSAVLVARKVLDLARACALAQRDGR